MCPNIRTTQEGKIIGRGGDSGNDEATEWLRKGGMQISLPQNVTYIAPNTVLTMGCTAVGSIYRESTMKHVTCASLLFCGIMAAVTASSLFAQGTSPGLAKELVADWDRAAAGILDIAEAMPEERYNFKPTPEMPTFGDQLVHVAGVVQRFIDAAKGTKSESGQAHKTMTKAEVIQLLKQTFPMGKEMIVPLTDAQLVEQVKFPIGDRMVTRYRFWAGPLQQFAYHHGQLVIYLRLNGIVPPATARRAR
jgi:uncharacterized damage-inducible protein DinB